MLSGVGGLCRHACRGEPEAQFPLARQRPLAGPQHATSTTDIATLGRDSYSTQLGVHYLQHRFEWRGK